MEYTLALARCSTNGTGDERNRALFPCYFGAAGQLADAEGAEGERNSAQQEQSNGHEPRCQKLFFAGFLAVCDGSLDAVNDEGTSGDRSSLSTVAFISSSFDGPTRCVQVSQRIPTDRPIGGSWTRSDRRFCPRARSFQWQAVVGCR
jgi:hypothetical protein